MTLSEPTLSFKENLIIVNISLIKHTPFINFLEHGKDTVELLKLRYTETRRFSLK